MIEGDRSAGVTWDSRLREPLRELTLRKELAINTSEQKSVRVPLAEW